MKKLILELKDVKALSNNEQKSILGGKPKNWDLCCLKEDSPDLPPLGCEAWVIC